jgi:hypothetical protein
MDHASLTWNQSHDDVVFPKITKCKLWKGIAGEIIICAAQSVPVPRLTPSNLTVKEKKRRNGD